MQAVALPGESSPAASDTQQGEIIAMKPKVFVTQPIPEIALDVLREAAEVSVYPHMDRQISVDELVANAKRADWLFVLHETNVTTEVIYANPNLKGIGAMASSAPLIDIEAPRMRARFRSSWKTPKPHSRAWPRRPPI
jgi:phosphoglycerate dehydrogenase-like enzyme